IRDFHVTGVQTCALPISVLLEASARRAAGGAAGAPLVRAGAPGHPPERRPAMSRRSEPGKLLRVAAVWGTQVLAVRHLRGGEALVIGDARGAINSASEGGAVPRVSLRAVRTCQ